MKSRRLKFINKLMAVVLIQLFLGGSSAWCGEISTLSPQIFLQNNSLLDVFTQKTEAAIFSVPHDAQLLMVHVNERCDPDYYWTSTKTANNRLIEMFSIQPLIFAFPDSMFGDSFDAKDIYVNTNNAEIVPPQGSVSEEECYELTRGLNSNSFILTGGAWGECHYQAFKVLLRKAIRECASTPQIILPKDAIYVLYNDYKMKGEFSTRPLTECGDRRFSSGLWDYYKALDELAGEYEIWDISEQKKDLLQKKGEDSKVKIFLVDSVKTVEKAIVNSENLSFNSLEKQERSIVDHILAAFGTTHKDLQWKKDKGSFNIANIVLTDENKDVVSQVFFPLEEKTIASGNVMILAYNDLPLYLWFINDQKEAEYINLTFYYSSLSSNKILLGMGKDIVDIFERQEIVRMHGFDAGNQFVYINMDPSSNSYKEVTIGNYNQWREEYLNLIWIFPGVWGPDSFSSRLIAGATAELTKPGMKVLVIGTGAGVEAYIAANKGAYVDAVDIRKMAVENTKITCSNTDFSHRVNAFVNDMYNGLGKYDLIVWNMPHYWPDLRLDGYAKSTNTTDKNGQILSRFAQGVTEHLTINGKVAIVNSAGDQLKVIIKSLLEQTSGLKITQMMGEEDTPSRIYILEQGVMAFEENDKIKAYSAELVGEAI
ncbi:MAG: methyltransferase [PVC group bacterium]|nr:methyltransferase [PVC group bacterium]